MMTPKEQAQKLLEAGRYAQRYASYIQDSAVRALADLERQDFDREGGPITLYAEEKLTTIYGDLLALIIHLNYAGIGINAEEN
jgi:hypothetical protein